MKKNIDRKEKNIKNGEKEYMKKIYSFLICVIITIGISGCGIKSTPVSVNNFDFISINDHLAYDSYTKNVYLKNHTYNFHYVYTDYLSEHMKHCKYINNQIVEVDDDGNVIEY